MSKYLFKTVCPACGSCPPRVWCHNSEKCGGERYIDKDLYLHCNKCNDKTLLFNATFKCEEHDDFREPNAQRLIRTLLLLNEYSNLPENINEELFIRGINYKSEEDDIRNTFSKYGEIVFCKILRDKETNKSKGIGFVKFQEKSQAYNAMKDSDNIECQGRKLKINYSINKNNNRDNKPFNRNNNFNDNNNKRFNSNFQNRNRNNNMNMDNNDNNDDGWNERNNVRERSREKENNNFQNNNNDDVDSW